MRIFFGATLPEATKAEITKLQKELRSSITEARIEGKDKLHITLQFIGDFESKNIERLYSSVVGELEKSSFKSSQVEIVGMNYFPNEKVRRGIWLDCEDDGTLASIADSIKSVTKEFGIIPESRAFKSHITIARLKGGERQRGGGNYFSTGSFGDLQKFAGQGKLFLERFFPKSVALFESTLNPDRSGSEYKILFEYPLQQSESA